LVRLNSFRFVRNADDTNPGFWTACVLRVVVPASDLFLSDYLRSIQLHLPDGFQPAYVVFVPTRR
jgi:hypothetical protein